MIEIQCTSCHTRYRIDERVLPDDTPTFKCSRCGHVFSADPAQPRARKMAPSAVEKAPAPEPPRTIRAVRPRPGALRSPIENDVVKRTDSRPIAASKPEPPAQPVAGSKPEPRTQPAQPVPAERPRSVERTEPETQASAAAPEPEARPQQVRQEAQVRREVEDDPLNRPFGDREQNADTGENLKFDFSSERSEIADAPHEHSLERPDSDDDEWQVGEPPSEFASAPKRQAPTMMDEPEAAMRPSPTPVRRMGSPLGAEAPRFAQPRQPRSAGYQLGDTVSGAGEEVSRGATHASPFFLAIFFFVFIAFFGASAIISGEPAASVRILSRAPRIGEYFEQPIVPAMLVTLHGVSSQYYRLKGGHVALVISGNAQNAGTRPLHLIEIDANLIGDDGARPLASQTVYCGNELSAKMLGEMTPREIEFSQGLSPQKTFALNPSATAPFLMVFVDPPTGAGKIRISVSKAAPFAAPLDSSAPAMPPA